MAALFGLFAGSDKAAKPHYSIEGLQHLYQRLQAISKDGSVIDEQSSLQVAEVIRQITEALIWGEQNNHDHNFFDFFCEKNILAEFVTLLAHPNVNRTVKVQLLQTLSMLVQNICRDTSLYYLFSNNYVNQLISTQFDWSDEEILCYYISFLKSLALRLNAETISFFFNERQEQFPLFVEAVRFFGHQDQMVRSAIRTLTLHIFRIEDSKMQKFVLERSKRTYFIHLACYLRELWLQLETASLEAANSGEQSAAALQDVNEQQQDLLMFLSDVLELKNSGYGEALAERLLRYALLPVLVGSLLEGGSDASGSPEPSRSRRETTPSGMVSVNENVRKISPTCAFFVLHQIFDIFRSPVLLEPLATALLRLTVSEELLSCCCGPIPPCPPTFRATCADISGPASVEPPPPQTTGLPAGAVDRHGADDAPLLSDSKAVAAGDATPVMMKEGDAGVENIVRPQFLGRFLLEHRSGPGGNPADACVLLVVGTLSAILRNRQVLAQASLEAASLLPVLPRENADEILRSLVEATAGNEDSSAKERSPAAAAPLGHPLEVTLLALEALGRHAQLRVIAVQVLACFTLILMREQEALPLPEEWRVPPRAQARLVVRSAARHVRSYLAGALGDSFLDVFAEEWDQNSPLSLDIHETCNNVHCLLPATTSTAPGAAERWNMPAARGAERQHAAKAVRCLLVVRRLEEGMLRLDNPVDTLENVAAVSASLLSQGYPKGITLGPQGASSPRPAPRSAPAEEEWLLRMREEVAEGYVEGRRFEMGRQDRIVCGSVTQEGRHTRYLMLQPFLLLLVQPDLVEPGYAVVRTLCPIRQVEPMIDRSDPRTLRLAIRLPKGAPCPGEATPFDPSSDASGFRVPAEEHRGSSFFMLTLSFEDIKRCLNADEHFRRRRQVVRADVRGRVEAFIERLSA